MASSRSKNLSPEFTDPYTVRLVKLRNILLSRPARVVPRSSEADVEAATSDHPLAALFDRPLSAPPPTFEEMMAVVNRHKGK